MAPLSWAGLCGLALALGGRHGLDADHLAAVDGLVRFNTLRGRSGAAFGGVLFGLGHGVVVVAAAVLAETLHGRWSPPASLETAGTLIAVALLFALAGLNLTALAKSSGPAAVAPVGLRSALLGRRLATGGPATALLTGVLFAISFDTLSLALLFAMLARRFGGPSSAFAVAGCFVMAMVAVDGGYGFIVASLARRADRAAAIASKVMTAGIGIASLAMAAVLLTVMAFRHAANWAERHQLLLSGAIAAAVVLSFVLALKAARPALTQRVS